MKILAQYNHTDRTIIGIEMKKQDIPKEINIDGKKLEILGICSGLPADKLAIEIPKTKENLVGKEVIW